MIFAFCGIISTSILWIGSSINQLQMQSILSCGDRPYVWNTLRYYWFATYACINTQAILADFGWDASFAIHKFQMDLEREVSVNRGAAGETLLWKLCSSWNVGPDGAFLRLNRLQSGKGTGILGCAYDPDLIYLVQKSFSCSLMFAWMK